MGRFLKVVSPATGFHAKALNIPFGTTAARPATPVGGAVRFNTDIAQIEYFNGTEFVTQASVGDVDLYVDTFTGDGSTATFQMAQEPTHETQIMVFIGSVYQDPFSAYSILEDDITFTSVPPVGETINVIHGMNSTDTTTRRRSTW